MEACSERVLGYKMGVVWLLVMLFILHRRGNTTPIIWLAAQSCRCTGSRGIPVHLLGLDQRPIYSDKELARLKPKEALQGEEPREEEPH
jgi:hypothetical protein